MRYQELGYEKLMPRFENRLVPAAPADAEAAWNEAKAPIATTAQSLPTLLASRRLIAPIVATPDSTLRG